MCNFAFKIHAVCSAWGRKLINGNSFNVSVNSSANRPNPNLCIRVALFKQSYQVLYCHTLPFKQLKKFFLVCLLKQSGISNYFTIERLCERHLWCFHITWGKNAFAKPQKKLGINNSFVFTKNSILFTKSVNYRCLFCRNSEGLIPSKLLKTRLKWVWLLKPTLNAISPICNFDSINNLLDSLILNRLI